jgi:hypothetical protein
MKFAKVSKDALRWQTLIKFAEIEHFDDRDGEPIFTIKIPVDWKYHDFRLAVDELILKVEDEKEELKKDKFRRE